MLIASPIRRSSYQKLRTDTFPVLSSNKESDSQAIEEIGPWRRANTQANRIATYKYNFGSDSFDFQMICYNFNANRKVKNSIKRIIRGRASEEQWKSSQ